MLRAHEIPSVTVKNREAPEKARRVLRKWLQFVDDAIAEVMVYKNAPITVTIGNDSRKPGPKTRKNK